MDFATRFASPYNRHHGNGLVTHGSTQPILTVLDLGGVELEEMYLIGHNDSCGRLHFPTRERAEQAAAVLEHYGYATTVALLGDTPQQQAAGIWGVTYDRRTPDGDVPSHLVTDMTVRDGTQIMRDGRAVGDWPAAVEQGDLHDLDPHTFPRRRPRP